MTIIETVVHDLLGEIILSKIVGPRLRVFKTRSYLVADPVPQYEADNAMLPTIDKGDK